MSRKKTVRGTVAIGRNITLTFDYNSKQTNNQKKETKKRDNG